MTKEEIAEMHLKNRADALLKGEIPNGWDLETRAQADVAAETLTKMHGKLYIGCDRGESISPRYIVIEAPAIGDPVSYAFNGDSYPCDYIVKVSKTLRAITTDLGHKFYRRGESAAWKYQGTWSMVKGHISSYNREF